MTRSFCAIALFVAACAEPAPYKEDAKGQIDESAPPSTPAQQDPGKADGSTKLVAVDVQSTHPYANNASKTYSVSLAALPSCARQARLHFKVLRTEADYDSVHVNATGEDFDGAHDDTWTEWFAKDSATTGVKLRSDGSITHHGFEIDAIEWDGQPAGCPQVRPMPCGAGTVDIQQTPGVCDCPVLPICESTQAIEVSHYQATGRNRTTKSAAAGVATYAHPGPTDATVTDTIGAIDMAKVGELVHRAGAAGLLQGAGYEHAVTPGDSTDTFTIKTSGTTVVFTATAGAHDPLVQQLVADFDALFTCDEQDSALACGAGYACESSTCIEQQSCVCPALYQPVCGTNSTTYGNACEAGCASVDVAHDGECGISGDTCGTMRGLVCQADYKCRFGDSQFTYPYPDAGGACVAANYCDAAADCAGGIHPAVPGQWACNANACAWQAGTEWKATSFAFETQHPYGNNQSAWYQMYLPAGTQAMRLVASSFATEAGYDFLEVWAWQNGAWTRVKRYSGTQGPTVTDEFPGQYFYLKFVSDSSVTKTGVTLRVEGR